MGDLIVLKTRNDVAKPTIKVKKLWLEQQIAEKKVRIQTLTTQAFAITEGQLKGIEADTIMAERDVMELTRELDILEGKNEKEIIDV